MQNLLHLLCKDLLSDFNINSTQFFIIILIIYIVVDISLQLHAKEPTLEQTNLRIEFMVQGRSSTLTIKKTTNIYFIFYFMI